MAHLTVYDASSRDRLSLYAWRVMFRELRDFRELVQRLVLRNFSAQFRQSFLGYVWVVVPPVATTLVFSMLRHAQIINIPMEGHAMPYTLYALTGITVWGLFTQFVMAATNSISGAGTLVSKIYFPREVLVLSGSGSALMDNLIRFGVVALSFALLRFAPAWQVVFLPLVLLPLVALAMGVGLILAPINAMMRDISRALEFVFQFGMLLVPTIYPTPDLEQAASASSRLIFWVHSLNPVSHFLYATRDLIEFGAFPITAGFTCSCVLSFLTLAIGWRFFHACEPLLAERL